VLAPGDLIATRLEQEPDMGLVDFHTEEPVQQHAALRDECGTARREDDCNNKGCCWGWYSTVPEDPICFPCGANDASQEGTRSTFPTLV